VKSEQWRYEYEVRIIRNLSDCEGTGKLCRGGFQIYIQKVPQDCIKEITLGERTRIEDQRRVWEKIRASNISLSLTAVANWGYEFRKELVKLGAHPQPVISPRTAHIFSHLPNAYGDVARYLIENHPLSEFVNTTG
jgi:hypothetical protein